ncbi:flocculation protein FLO11, partial [Hyalella azteca]|uniref:Flocculation protein FLO11 n=1 Tax=Hyalella azteca TaxID=294128 RepID=A0A8B7NG55_HYAAZ
YGKPLSEFSLLTAPLAGESKLREALRVPVTAAQSTFQSVETKDIKQEDPPELVDVCSVSDDEAVKDRLACDSSTSTTIAPPATKKPDQLSVASSSTALREVRAFGKILPSSTSFKSARGSSGAITRSVSPPPIQSPLGGTSTRPSSLPPDVNCLTSNSTQSLPVQRPNSTQTTSAQRPNRTQTPPVQRPNSTQTPSAQRPNSTQTPLAQHPNYNQEPRATEHFHNSHVVVPQVVQVPIPRRYAAISTPQYLPPVNVVSSHRNSYETQESFGYPRPGYPDRRRSIGDSPYVQEGFYRQGSLIPSRTPGVRAADDHIKVDYELRRNANAYKDRSSASSVKVVNVDHLKTDQSLMRRSNSFSSRNGWPSSYSQSTSIERLRYATACSITPICTTKISTPKVQKVYTKNMTVRNMSAETGVEIIQVDESPRPMPPTPTDETSSNSSSSFPVPDSSVRRQNTNLEERPVISASQSTSPQSSDSVYSWRPLEVDESRAEFSENSGSSPEGVTNDPLLTKISSTKRRRVRGPRSWEYLLRLLRDPSTNPSLIRWENESEGIFRLVKPDAIALRWGKRTGKHFTEMLSYENFARGLRYHYVTGALSAVSERCFVYKFGPKAEHALQYPERISDNIVGTHSDESNN